MTPRAFVFDAYGTLFDVHSVAPDRLALSQLWRQKQLEYTWLRSLMNRYEDFWRVT
jgi:2-haloacid dehalogenase